jgi:arylsulfatase A-like enzyme
MAATFAPLAAQEKAKRPNILFIMSDDHASAAISAYGPGFLGKFANTPNIDRIAKGGVLFKNACVTNSICTPSRAAILTGQYSHKNGVYTLADALDPTKIHIAHLLRNIGYQTAIIGKWHLATDPQGFDYWNILPGQGVYHDPKLRPMGAKQKDLVNHPGKYSEDVITDYSLEWLKKRDKNKPFLLFCHYKAPHRPWDPAPRFASLYKDDIIPEPPTLLDDHQGRAKVVQDIRMVVGRDFSKRDLEREVPKDLDSNALRKWAYQHYMKRYLGCVAAVDENVGRLLDFLDSEGLANDTVVVYTSDQGFFLGEHGFYDKRLMYEPCLTTPLVVRYPAHAKAGHVSNDLILNIDHAATFLDFAGAAPAADMDGKSYKGILAGNTPRDWRTSMYYRYYMHLDGSHNVPAHYGVRTPRYTLIHFYNKGLGMKGASQKELPPEWELFDREKDPQQVRNVYADPAYADTVRELKAELERLRRELKDDK